MANELTLFVDGAKQVVSGALSGSPPCSNALVLTGLATFRVVGYSQLIPV
jgi:hypothetical protein